MFTWGVVFLSIIFLGSGLAKEAPMISDLAGLKRLERQVKAVVSECRPATVSLISIDGTGSGSGIVVSPDGLILTAAHVTDGYRRMRVVFPDGRSEGAVVLGANYSRDASMVKLLGEGPYPHVELGKSRSLEVGNFVVAMGHTKGFDPTRKPPVRFGRVMTRGSYGFITTDCTVLAGDSGGPLFDLNGKLVGIHSHIAPDKKVNNHAEVEGYLRSWVKMKNRQTWGVLGGRRPDHSRPVLGVTLEDVSLTEGILVKTVRPLSPALAAGLRPGDLLLEVAGEGVSTAPEVGDALIDFEPGETIPVTFRRGERQLQVPVTLLSVDDIYRNAGL